MLRTRLEQKMLKARKSLRGVHVVQKNRPKSQKKKFSKNLSKSLPLFSRRVRR